MSTMTLSLIPSDDWAALTANWPGRSLVHGAAYGDAKAADGAWAVERGVITDGDVPMAAFQALIKRLPGGLPGGLAWISRGPLFAPQCAASRNCFDIVMESIRRYYTTNRGYYLRVAPSWPSADARDVAGFCPAGATGWRSAKLDLTSDEAVLRKGLKQKWRNALNKAGRSGLGCRAIQAGDGFSQFLADHDAFTAQAGFAATITAAFLRRLQDALPAEGKMTAFQGQLDGKTLGWVLSVRTGDTVEYLAGNSTDDGRRLAVGQFLLWQAIMAAKADGARTFDLGGMDEEQTPPGILKFKQGVGAIPYEMASEIEALPSGIVSGPLARLVRWRVQRARAMV